MAFVPLFVSLSLLCLSSSFATECSPRPLGMQNKDIADSQITASSQFDSNHGATNGRLNFAAGGGKTGAWSSRTNDVNQWLRVDLGQRGKVTGIQIQGREDCCNQFVTSYTLSHSNDGTTFTDYTQNGQVTVFAGNSDKTTVITQFLSPAINARYIRINPKSWSEHISLRIELLGCRTELPSYTCRSMKAKGFCPSPAYQARCPTQCPSIACLNYMPDEGVTSLKTTVTVKNTSQFVAKPVSSVTFILSTWVVSLT
ncbi:oligosaccharide binding [Desmophyllum pertusum]|uniref:Oligosaccharide binding n=1 Tax=Desmophyllum pertusum TaxID=174260 RepID=A0A9W9ZJK3_9CNID|nr:oligosaccharide binding [Desmophyllum pertusum]